MVLAGCSTVDNAILATENGTSRMFGGGPKAMPLPEIDLQTLAWQKLSDTSSVQMASVPNTEAGTAMVALKVPAGEAIPAFFQDVPETNTVLEGSFVLEGIDSAGRVQHIIQGPGVSTRVPARMIQHVSATAAGDCVMLITLNGAWKPSFVDEHAGETQRAAN